MDTGEEREIDTDADAALEGCAVAARTHAWVWSQNELRLLYGRSAGRDAAERLRQPPFDVLSAYQVARVRAWHSAQRGQPLATKLRLAAEYAGTGDYEPAPEAATLRAIARRAGVRTEVRIAALEIACGWAEDAGEVLRLLTKRWPAYEDVYCAFSAEADKVYGVRSI